jgi:hypothetical protein
MKRMCLFMSMILILIQHEFDINNDKLLETIWALKKRNKIADHHLQCAIA